MLDCVCAFNSILAFASPILIVVVVMVLMAVLVLVVVDCRSALEFYVFW